MNLILRQGFPLNHKILMTKDKIKEWYEFYDGKVYVADSGGKDSTVLRDLVRSIYPDVPSVFCNTGLEFPEIIKFVRSTKNVIWLKPTKSFNQVIKEYGYPVISKKISMGIDRYHNTKSEYQKHLRLHGGINPTSGKKQYRTISKKWHFLVDAPFKCSEKCCYFLKKAPFKKYEKETGRKPFIGTMASDSDIRKEQYLKTGCNSFDTGSPKSTPLGFWIEKDIWDYIKINNVPYSDIYNKGYDRTGCMFCMFGIHMEKNNRFELLKDTHPKHYKYCMEKLGLRDVLRYITNTGEHHVPPRHPKTTKQITRLHRDTRSSDS